MDYTDLDVDDDLRDPLYRGSSDENSPADNDEDDIASEASDDSNIIGPSPAKQTDSGRRGVRKVFLSGSTAKPKKKPGVNLKFPCPECCTGKAIPHLPRHLMNHHGYSKDRAKAVGTTHGNPDLRSKDRPKPKEQRPYRYCHIPGCSTRTTNITEHLKIKRHAEDITDEATRQHYLRLSWFPKEESAVESTSSEEPAIVSTMKDFEAFLRVEYLVNPSDPNTKHIDQTLQKVRDTFTVRKVPDSLQLFNDMYFKTKVLDPLLLAKLGGDTISSYCLAFGLFAKFCRKQRCSISFETCEVFRETMRSWSLRYKRDAEMDREERREEDQHKRVNTDDTKLIFNSEYQMETHRLLHDPNTPVSRSTYVRTRNMILCKFATGSAQRSAPCLLITIGQLRKCFKMEPDCRGSRVIKFPKHKSRKKHGAADMPVDADLFLDLTAWYQRFRPYAAGCRSTNPDDLSDKAALFKPWRYGSDASDSSAMSKILTDWAKKTAGLDKKWCNNHYRSTAVTEMANHAPQLSESLAMLMTHSKTTADRHYRIFNKTKNALEMVPHMHRLRMGQLAEKTSTAHDGEAAVSPNQASSSRVEPDPEPMDCSVTGTESIQSDDSFMASSSRVEPDPEPMDCSVTGTESIQSDDSFMSSQSPNHTSQPPNQGSQRQSSPPSNQCNRASRHHELGLKKAKSGVGRPKGRANFSKAVKAAVRARYWDSIKRADRVSPGDVVNDLATDPDFVRRIGGLSASQVYNLIGSMVRKQQGSFGFQKHESDSDSS